MKRRAVIAVAVLAAVVAVVSTFELRRLNDEPGPETSQAVERVATPDPRGMHVVVRDRSGQLARSFVEFGPYRRGERPVALLSSQTCSYADDGETWIPRPTEPTIVHAAFNGHCELGPLLYGSSRIALLDPEHLPAVLTLEVEDDDELVQFKLRLPDDTPLGTWAQIRDELGLIVAEPKVDWLGNIRASLPRGKYTAQIVSVDWKELALREFAIDREPVFITLNW